jgi:thiamine-monophosphate kinase
MSGPDEFETIARLLRPLANGAPEALDLRDDAAAIPSRPGYDLVVTKDVLVAGVHFLPDDPLDLVARKLLRVNLSDLAAKGAEPYGYFLSTCWPQDAGWPAREAFARGLGADQEAFGLKLFGGDTVVTPGPLTVGATMLGWVPSGAMVRRSGAREGDLVQVSGPIGDGWLGLAAALGSLEGLNREELEALADRYRLPRPRIDLDLAGAAACADISDGLLADAGHIGEASGLGVEIDLDRLPLSAPAALWLAGQGDRAAGLIALATGGDDYEFVAAAPRPLPGFTVVGRMNGGQGLSVTLDGRPIGIARTGWRHGNDG